MAEEVRTIEIQDVPNGRPIGGRLTDEEREARKQRRKAYRRNYYLKHKTPKEHTSSNEEKPTLKVEHISDPESKEFVEKIAALKKSSVPFSDLLDMMLKLSQKKQNKCI